MKLLGHGNIKNTLLYTQLVKPGNNDDNYISEAARATNKARMLVEAGYP
ncbi:hypothetical protein KAU85_00085 [Candidatus Bathyarchaeota archaeon]|nr:hypothetical protein [Candidatus Bathyarchaeota archaeon]